MHTPFVALYTQPPVLDFMPERLGHALELEGNTSFFDAIMRRNTLVEICPTSNKFTLQLGSYAEHPTLRRWLDCGHPIAISTDDCGVFNTTLSEEFTHVANAFALGKEQLCKLSIEAARHIFAEQAIVDALRVQLEDECEELMSTGGNPAIRAGL
jgi:adenosine deaminase